MLHRSFPSFARIRFPKYHRRATATSHIRRASGRAYSRFPQRSFALVAGQFGASTFVSDRTAVSISSREQFSSTLMNSCWLHVNDEAPCVANTFRFPIIVTGLAGRDFAMLVTWRLCLLRALSRPHTRGLTSGLLKPPPVRASRKSAPPEGRPQFSACPVRCAPDSSGFFCEVP